MKRSQVLALGFAVLLGGCAHKPLKAPCEPGDAQPLAALIAFLMPEVFSALIPVASECDPLRPL